MTINQVDLTRCGDVGTERRKGMRHWYRLLERTEERKEVGNGKSDDGGGVRPSVEGVKEQNGKENVR